MNIKMMRGFEPIVEINNIALQKMNEYTNQSNEEIGWLGTARKLEDKHYIIDDVFLFRQEVHSTTTEITVEGLSEFCQELMMRENGMEIWNNMKVWGHSHVNMSTSPSGQDDRQMEVFADSNDDFFIRIITNKQGDLRLDIYDFESGIIYEQLKYIPNYGEKEEVIRTIQTKIQEYKKKLDEILGIRSDLVKEIKDEIKDKVTKKTYKNYNGNYKTNFSNEWDNWYNSYDKSSKKKEIKEESVSAEDVFAELSEDLVFEIKTYMDNGGDIQDYLDVELSITEKYILEDKIDEYCEEFYNDYLLYTINLEEN